MTFKPRWWQASTIDNPGHIVEEPQRLEHVLAEHEPLLEGNVGVNQGYGAQICMGHFGDLTQLRILDGAKPTPNQVRVIKPEVAEMVQAAMITEQG
jgi:hypothetical protein